MPSHTTTAAIATSSESAPDLVREPVELMTPAEVAELFRVDPKTVTRWGKAGYLPSVRTLGGHRRYPAAQIEAILTGQQDTTT